MKFLNRIFKKRVQKQSVINLALTDPDNLSVDDYNELPEINNVEDLLKLSKLWKKYAVPYAKHIENDHKFSESIKISTEFFKDLAEDKIFTDFHSFNNLFLFDAPDALKFIQSCDEIPSWHKLKKLEPVELSRTLNSNYLNLYENIIKFGFMNIAKKIDNTNNISKGTAIRILKKYRNRKYSEYFSLFNPKIRNPAGHTDSLWKPELKKVEFSDGDSPPIYLSLKDYYQLCCDLRTLAISTFYCVQKIREPTWKLIMEKAQIVYDYAKEHNMDIKKELSSKSLKDIVEDIEKGLI